MTARRVFVSYSQHDRDTAFGIVAHLERDGIACWVAPRDVAPGADWAAEIVDAIAAADVMVLVFSASANASPQVRREVERAVNRGVEVLPFRVEDVLPARSLEYFLSSQHWLDAFPPPMEPHYARLSRYLQAMPAAAGRGSGMMPELPPAAAAPGSHAAPKAAPDAATLRRLEAELARYIGPVARLLVQRAALRAASVDALIAQLGAEIDSESERRLFLDAIRQQVRVGSH
ncbi:MAG TPA: toll/interleukin-1 receptor domain-containing protein [Steroidobacteraceae bacterium]|nr:toll/interleukin-1 receptor domain-containing protein [Steroidobacteraceae bacterium]